MTIPSPHPPNSQSSATDRSSSSVPPPPPPPPSLQKSQSQAWGLGQNQPSRRGLAPISTAFSTNQSKPSISSQSPAPRNPWSPPGTAFSAGSTSLSSNKPTVRSPSIPSSVSPFSPPQPLSGQQQHHSSSSSNPLLSSARSRALASSNNPNLASVAAASQTSGPGTSGGGGSSKNFRVSPSLSSSNFGSPTLTANSGSSGAGKSGPLTQIVVAQLFLLLSTIKEDKDSPKWEQEADKIRKLVETNGMEVFTKYFRRLLVQNSSQIWGPARSTESSGSYPILSSEIKKVSQDPLQASKIVESVEFGEGEIFKDFDLFTFMEHFKMSPQSKITLAISFKKASKLDLKTKADAIISNNLHLFLNSFGTADSSQIIGGDEVTVFASILNRLAQDPPRNWTGELHQNLVRNFEERFSPAIIPLEISSALFLFNVATPAHTLVRLVQKKGPRGTESVDACKIMLESAEMRDISYQQVANTLLFMVIAQDELQYDAGNFVSALREHRGGQRLDWQDVVHAFDREGLRITKVQFKSLFDALIPIAHDNKGFDIQLLWGGDWRHEETQLSFAAAFLSFSEIELDASQIPRLNKAYTLEDFADASEEIKAYAETASKHPLVSLDATKALFRVVFQTSDTYSHAQSFGVVDNIINPKMDLFVGSVSAVPKPWGALQDQAIKQLVGTLFFSGVSGHGFALHLLWKRDRQWLTMRLLQLYQQNPMHLIPILELAHEYGWLNELIASNSQLTLDLAALAHGRNLFDLEDWLQQIIQAMQRDRVVPAICTFLNQKIEHDVATQKDKTPPRTVPLTVRTAHALLTFLGNEGLHEVERTQLQRASIAAYPRLINYGEGFDEIIDANGQEGNALSAEADVKMQEHYKQMYSLEIQVRDVVEILQSYKMSQDPADQDLFACMIFGLFDEYNCFGEYPLTALATTAVLFGSIINFNLLSKVALQVAISMVLEAVRDYQPEDSMYKFGLQALLNFQDRLEEWTRLSEILLEIPGLQDTPIYSTLEKIARDKEEAPNGEQNENEKTVSAADDFLAAEPNVPDFTCLGVDPPTRPDFYEEPDEDVQEGVLFVLNNVSERNLKDKCSDLKSLLKEEHHQWFASYVVESRIKSQPNFHQLYMDILYEFDNKYLWSEVLRETFVCIIRMLNAESTMTTNERSLLKNLGAWLGAMTLARDQSIKHRNISFKDLLVEAHDTQRLLVAIPFTCKVLAMAARSSVFKPPCAWTVEILQILIELYEHSELKLNLKFEVEVLCKTLDVDHKELEASNIIRSRPLLPEDEILPTTITDNMEGFNDLSLIHLSRPRGMAERFSPTTIIPQLAELTTTLKHQYNLPPLNATQQSRIRMLLSDAVERAVSEIIGPVVERSVTIAAISASQLIAKDLALESDGDRYREISHKSVRALAGSLAQVTCKEPLRASMQNNIQHMRQDLPEQALPQGSILIFINDNLDTVCSFVEKAAESASTNEIDAQIEDAMQLRQRQNFSEPQISRWAYYIPEPYKPTSGGLNQDQLAIYEDFCRTGRAFPVHSSLSQESSRQLSDVLQDQFSNAFPPVVDGQILHSSVHQPFPDHTGRSPQDLQSQALMNGFVNGQGLESRASECVRALRRSALESMEEDSSRPLSDSTSVREAWVRLFQEQMAVVSLAQKHDTALTAAKEAINILVQSQDKSEVLDLMAQVLRKLCDGSDMIAQYIYTWCMDPHQERMLNSSLTVALLKSGLLNVHRVDLVIAAAIRDRKPGILDFLRELIDAFWLNEAAAEFPGAWRADLALSMTALTQWMATDSGLTKGQEIKQSLQDSAIDVASTQEDQGAAKDVQLEYVFNEWTKLQMNNTSSLFQVSFAQQLYTENILTSREATVAFLRACLNASVLSFEQNETRLSHTVDELYLKTDALARLLVVVMAYQGGANGAKKADKISFFDELVSLLVLVISQHYQSRGESFNQKVFFRLFSTVITELHSMFSSNSDVDTPEIVQGSMNVLGKSLLMLSPRIFPALSFAWLTLISHRAFMPVLLNGASDEGRTIFCELLCQQVSYVGELMKPLQIDFASKDYYRGTLQLLLVLHHDFPQFLAENYLQFLNNLPSHCTQMRSLIISASPAFPEFPDPFHEGLKVDRLDDSKRSPVIRGGLDKVENNAILLSALQGFLNGNVPSDEHVSVIVQAICDPVPSETGPGFLPVATDVPLLNALVIYIVQQAEATSRQRSLVFSASSQHAQLLDALVDKLNPEARYHLLNAIVNQLRYPNSHTHYFSYVLFHLYRAGKTDRLAVEVQQQIVRSLLERIVAHRPHPWGLMVVLLEFLKNETYHLWDTPFVKAAPDVQRMLSSLLQQMGQNARTLA